LSWLRVLMFALAYRTSFDGGKGSKASRGSPGVSSGAVELSGGSPCPFLIRRSHVRRIMGAERDGGQQNIWRDNDARVKKRTQLKTTLRQCNRVDQSAGWHPLS